MENSLEMFQFSRKNQSYITQSTKTVSVEGSKAIGQHSWSSTTLDGKAALWSRFLNGLQIFAKEWEDMVVQPLAITC